MGKIDESDTYCGSFPPYMPHAMHAAARKNTAMLSTLDPGRPAVTFRSTVIIEQLGMSYLRTPRLGG